MVTAKHAIKAHASAKEAAKKAKSEVLLALRDDPRKAATDPVFLRHALDFYEESKYAGYAREVSHALGEAYRSQLGDFMGEFKLDPYTPFEISVVLDIAAGGGLNAFKEKSGELASFLTSASNALQRGACYNLSITAIPYSQESAENLNPFFLARGMLDGSMSSDREDVFQVYEDDEMGASRYTWPSPSSAREKFYPNLGVAFADIFKPTR